MKDKLIIYGASGHGKVIIDVVEKEDRFKIVGLLDDDSSIQGHDFCGYSILGGFELLNKDAYQNCKLILAIGDNRVRRCLWQKQKYLGYKLARVAHPSAQVARDVLVGSGTVIMANTAVNSGTKVGENVIINTGATVDHDCIIEDYVHISPGVHLAGNVKVGELSHIGIGASVIQGVRIGKNSVIGAGSAVIGNIPDNVIAVGIPADVIKHRKNGGLKR